VSAFERGEIYWADLDPTVGGEMSKRRPAVIVSITLLNATRRTVLIMPLSTKGVHRLPLVVAVPSAGANATARIDQVRAVDKSRLHGLMGKLTREEMDLICQGLRVVMEL
jgi:mRNA interferase MazF